MVLTADLGKLTGEGAFDGIAVSQVLRTAWPRPGRSGATAAQNRFRQRGVWGRDRSQPHS